MLVFKIGFLMMFFWSMYLTLMLQKQRNFQTVAYLLMFFSIFSGWYVAKYSPITVGIFTVIAVLSIVIDILANRSGKTNKNI